MINSFLPSFQDNRIDIRDKVLKRRWPRRQNNNIQLELQIKCFTVELVKDKRALLSFPQWARWIKVHGTARESGSSVCLTWFVRHSIEPKVEVSASQISEKWFNWNRVVHKCLSPWKHQGACSIDFYDPKSWDEQGNIFKHLWFQKLENWNNC